MKTYSEAQRSNVGSGEEITIRGLAERVAKTVSYDGRLRFDTSKPDGTPRELVDMTRLHGLGRRSAISLRDGLKAVYAWFKAQPREALRLA